MNDRDKHEELARKFDSGAISEAEYDRQAALLKLARAKRNEQRRKSRLEKLEAAFAAGSVPRAEYEQRKALLTGAKKFGEG